MTTRGSKVELRPLRDDSDWENVRTELESLASVSTPRPWTCWQHVWSLHQLFWPEATVWLTSLIHDGLTVGVLLLKEELQGHGWKARRVLRSLDAMVLETASLWCRVEEETLCAGILAANLGTISRATGADLLCLYRQEKRSVERISAALTSLRHRHQMQTFTMGQQIRVPEDLEEYFRHVGSKRIRDIRRRGRKLLADSGHEPAMDRFRGCPFASSDFQPQWRSYESLRLKSWQLQDTRDSGKADPQAVLAYYEAMARHWSSQNSLELILLRVGEEIAAAHLNVLHGDRVWLLVMNHDPRWRSHGVGMQLFLQLIESGHALGDRLFDMGGEANDWKADWSTGEYPICKLIIPLDSLRGRLWSVASRIGR